MAPPRNRAAKDAPEGTEGAGPLAFVHDMDALAQRFVLVELLAPPLALRLRRGAAPPGEDATDRGVRGR